MKVKVAGYNLDADVIEGLKSAFPNGVLTPETISAAYARISRSDRTIEKLRSDAINDIKSSRKTNEKVVFGYGHSAVAESCVFNIDIEDLSRLGLEYLERHRLVSFIERSQRYTFSNGGYFLPPEITDMGLRNRFIHLMELEKDSYDQIYRQIKAGLVAERPELTEKQIDQMAKEDARYCLSLAFYGQVGMTVNARNVEYIIKSLRSVGLKELDDLADKLYKRTYAVSPSLIRYTDPTPYQEYALESVYSHLDAFSHLSRYQDTNETQNDPINAPIKLLFMTPLAEERIIAGVLFELGYGPFDYCIKLTNGMNRLEKERFIFYLNKDLGDHDCLLRQFELVDLVFELDVSAACYGQLKRHRMTTQIVSDYSIRQSLPETVINFGLPEFDLVTEKAFMLHEDLLEQYGPKVSQYVCLNANKRRVLLKTNLRELGHMIKLRTKPEAQWEIRNTVLKMQELVNSQLTFPIKGIS